MLERLNTLWFGNQLKYTEQLCIASARAVGHQFRIYSYDPEALKGVPSGVELRDAREVLPEERLLRYSDTGAVALGSDLFRYAMLAKGLGYWVDLDLCFLRPLDFTDPYVFGWEYAGWLNNAVLKAPADSELTRDLCALPQTNWRPPWYGPRRTLQYYWRRITKGDIKVQDLPWGTIASGLLTYLAKKHDLAERAQKPWVFYPLEWKDAPLLYGDAGVIEKKLKPDTRTVHMWHSRLVGLVDKRPPQGSFMHAVCRRYGV